MTDEEGFYILDPLSSFSWLSCSHLVLLAVIGSIFSVLHVTGTKKNITAITQYFDTIETFEFLGLSWVS